MPASLSGGQTGRAAIANLVPAGSETVMALALGRIRRGMAAALLALLAGTAPAAAFTKDTLEATLTQDGYNFARTGDAIWTIDFTGKSAGAFKTVLAVAADEKLVVMFVVLVDHTKFTVPRDLLYTLARQNFALDRAKLGLDDDGDLFVRIDGSPHAIDTAELKIDIEQLAACADAAYAALQPVLQAPQN
jgi:hypothetical protein